MRNLCWLLFPRLSKWSLLDVIILKQENNFKQEPIRYYGLFLIIVNDDLIANNLFFIKLQVIYIYIYQTKGIIKLEMTSLYFGLGILMENSSSVLD